MVIINWDNAILQYLLYATKVLRLRGNFIDVVYHVKFSRFSQHFPAVIYHGGKILVHSLKAMKQVSPHTACYCHGPWNEHSSDELCINGGVTSYWPATCGSV